MSDMYSQFEADKDLEINGVWNDYGDFRIKLAHTGGANKKYQSLAETLTKPFRRLIQTGTMPETRSLSILLKLFVETVIRDWEILDGETKEGKPKWKKGIHKKGGGVLPFNKDNVAETLKALPALFSAIQAHATDAVIYLKEEMEEDSKNS